MPRRAVRRPRRKLRPRRRYGRKAKASPQMAKIVESIEFNRLSPNLVQSMTFNINQFERARTLATNFRWYKPTKVCWTIEPQYNVFQSGPASNSVPYLYQVMNRTQDASTLNLNDILTQGAKPQRLIGVKKTTYRPNWCSPGLIVQNVVPIPGVFGGALNNVFMNGLQAQYGWLQAPNNLPIPPITINPQQVDLLGQTTSSANTLVKNVPGSTLFNGHQVYIEQQVPAGGVSSVFKVSCTVHWSFKDPKNTLASGTDNIFEDLSGSVVP